jgi:hypothetical protein
MTVTINGTTGVAGVDGTAATPAIQGNDTNTGIFFPAADTIAFAEGGAEVARFDSSGNLIVGSTSATTGDRVVNTITYDGNNGYAGSRTATVWGDSTVRASAQADGGNGQLILGTESDHRTIFVTNNSERMRIDSNGDLLVGTTTVVSGSSTDRSGIVVKGTIGTRASMKVCANNDTATFALIIFANDTDGQIGSVTQNSNGTVNYNTNSDYRLKQNIVSMTGALDKVSQLKPCIGNWKKNNAPFQGFIAHELQEIVPECVTGEKDAIDEEGKPIYQGVDTSFLVATLTCAIQELKAELDTVKTELATLKGQA